MSFWTWTFLSPEKTNEQIEYIVDRHSCFQFACWFEYFWLVVEIECGLMADLSLRKKSKWTFSKDDLMYVLSLYFVICLRTTVCAFRRYEYDTRIKKKTVVIQIQYPVISLASDDISICGGYKSESNAFWKKNGLDSRRQNYIRGGDSIIFF